MGVVRIAACAALLAAAGCSRAPARIAAPDWDPPEIAERILADLDKNADAHVDAQEWAAAPGLAAGAKFIDKDNDGRLSGPEVVARFEAYRDRRVGIQSRLYRVTYKGRPVAGAEVTFQPEPFLEDVTEPAAGTTDDDGVVAPQIAGEEKHGMRPGYYRVKVSAPQLKLPADAASKGLGVESSPIIDDPFASQGTVELRLPD